MRQREEEGGKEGEREEEGGREGEIGRERRGQIMCDQEVC